MRRTAFHGGGADVLRARRSMPDLAGIALTEYETIEVSGHQPSLSTSSRVAIPGAYLAQNRWRAGTQGRVARASDRRPDALPT
eukprot:2556012-Rhodomonas_salina.1